MKQTKWESRWAHSTKPLIIIQENYFITFFYLFLKVSESIQHFVEGFLFKIKQFVWQNGPNEESSPFYLACCIHTIRMKNYGWKTHEQSHSDPRLDSNSFNQRTSWKSAKALLSDCPLMNDVTTHRIKPTEPNFNLLHFKYTFEIRFLHFIFVSGSQYYLSQFKRIDCLNVLDWLCRTPSIM